MDIHHDLMTPREGEMEEQQSEQVIIYCGMHGLYERADHNGYTNDPRKAGIYERAKVQDLVESPYSDRKNELLPVPHDHETRIAERIASLTAERDALAGLVAQLRGALEAAELAGNLKPAEVSYGELLIADHKQRTLRQAALALPLPDAAENVEQWREKAERLDDWAAKWEEYCVTPTDADEKEREAFIDADLKLRRYARELRAGKVQDAE
jgi:hypothetical protein